MAKATKSRPCVGRLRLGEDADALLAQLEGMTADLEGRRVEAEGMLEQLRLLRADMAEVLRVLEARAGETP